MKDFLSVLQSSKLFSGVSENELTAMLSCLDTKKRGLSKGCLYTASRRYA